MEQGTATCTNSQCPEHGVTKAFGGFDEVPEVIVCGSCSERCSIEMTGPPITP